MYVLDLANETVSFYSLLNHLDGHLDKLHWITPLSQSSLQIDDLSTED
jgi:hypothetical protein